MINKNIDNILDNNGIVFKILRGNKIIKVSKILITIINIKILKNFNLNLYNKEKKLSCFFVDIT